MPRSVAPYLAQAVLLVLALVPFFPGVFLRGEVLVPMSHVYAKPPWAAHRPAGFLDQNPLGSEVTAAVCVWYTLTDAAFERGELPLWSPYQFMGAPLIGNFQSSVFYPPRLMFRFFDDTYAAMTVYILFRFWLCGFNAFVAGRILGLRTPFANLFSFLFMLSGYNGLWTFYPPPDVMAWMPLLLAGSESLLNARYRLGTALMTVSVTMAILAAHPSTLILGCVGTSLYSLVRLAAMRGPMRHVLVCAVCAGWAFAIALAVSAVQLGPFIEYMREAEYYINRFFPEGAAHYVYSGFDLLGLFGARMLGTQVDGNFWGLTNHTYVGMLYVGIVTWVCLSLLASRAPVDEVLRTRIRLMLVVSAVCVYLATPLPLADVVQNLPGIKASRPAYFFAFPTLALPLCAAFAVQTWNSAGAAARSLVRPAVLAGAVAVAVAGVVALAPYLSQEYIEQVGKGVDLGPFMTVQCGIAAAIAISAFVVLAIRAYFPRGARLFIVGLCVVAIADQAITMWGVMATTPRPYVMPRTKITDFLAAKPKPFRVRFDTAGLDAAYPTLYGIEEFEGYDAVYPKRFKPYRDELDVTPGTTGDALLSCGAAAFRSGVPLPAKYEAIAEGEGLTIAVNPESFPRARLVGSIVTFESTKAMIEAMKKPDFDPRAVVYTDAPVNVALPADDGQRCGDASIEAFANEHVRVRATAQRECVLVLADGYAPGWRATVDGAPAPIFPAYYLYRGVHLTPGEHTVDFEYRPIGYRAGLVVSYTGLGMSAVMALMALRGRPR